MLTVRVKKFIQKTGRNLDFKEKHHVSLDKSKIECYNCHINGHFTMECRSRRNQGRISYGDNGRSNAPTNESSSQALVAQDGLGSYDWSNDFEVEPVNYALMAISSSSSSSSFDNESDVTFLLVGFVVPTGLLTISSASIVRYGSTDALGSGGYDAYWLGRQVFIMRRLGGYVDCQSEEIHSEDRKELLESFKTLQKNYDSEREKHSREESSKNLDELLNSQMSARDKTGLGYGTQLNEMSNNSETDSEISLSVFDVRSSDEESTPTNDRFSNAVPPPITGNFLTPRADISFAGLDEYAIIRC
ncbi:ribonuclease H-like domain-containing protein [Tanacetum coccineum]